MCMVLAVDSVEPSQVCSERPEMVGGRDMLGGCRDGEQVVTSHSRLRGKKNARECP